MTPRRLNQFQTSQPSSGNPGGVGRLIAEGSGLGADIFRHSMLLIGVVGLVAIAAGALTDSTAYWTLLNWISSFFCRG